MDKVIIKNLSARGIIGVNDWERVKKQEILINAILFADFHQAGENDKIQDCVNYRTISKLLLAHAEKAARFTVESLAEDLARICLQQPKVERVIIRVEKPGAIRFAESVGVEIERSKGK